MNAESHLAEQHHSCPFLLTLLRLLNRKERRARLQSGTKESIDFFVLCLWSGQQFVRDNIMGTYRRSQACLRETTDIEHRVRDLGEWTVTEGGFVEAMELIPSHSVVDAARQAV